VIDLQGIINLRITLVRNDGLVIADSSIINTNIMDNHLYRPEINQSLRSGSGSAIRYSNTLRTDELYYAMRSGRIVIRVAKPLNEIDENMAKISRLIIVLGIFTLVIAFIFTIAITKRITNPINETISFSKEFASGNLTSRIMNYSDDEIGDLQRSLNKMADILSEKINKLVIEQNKLDVAMNSIIDGLSVIDSNGYIQISNKSFCSIFGINEIIGNKYYEVIRSSVLNSKIETCLKSGTSETFVEDIMGEKSYEIYITTIMQEHGAMGLLVMLHNVTEKKRIERLKTDLVGNLSHELKTPIAILKGYLETIDEYLDDKEQCRSYIRKAIANADRQNAIINDMLKLNMLETSQHFPSEIIDVKEVINNCLNLLSLKITDKGINLTVELDSLNDGITGNRFLAEEIFFNIIDNAVNYNIPSGSLQVRSEKFSSRHIITIADTGIGIPFDSIDRIFERFYRVDRGRSRSTGGTGLGLSIVKHAVDILGWEVHVTSCQEGSVFSIEMPITSKNLQEDKQEPIQ
jgi:two-component system phosphate regulon sensor histidine kinase PhoR